MRIILMLALSINYTLVLGQSHYVPPKPDTLSEAKYRDGKLLFENALAQMNGRDNKVYAHDYWNFAVAYAKMGQSKDSIFNFIVKSRMINEADFCMIANLSIDHYGGLERSPMYRDFGIAFKMLLSGCADLPKENKKLSPTEYAIQNGFDVELVKRLNSLLERDQKYRVGSYNAELQNVIDAENLEEIKAIISEFGYPGRTLVGREYESTVWLVIQHSSLAVQEMYLPVIARSVAANELHETPLKMLLDRIYVKRTGLQIFGSQIGIKFSDDSTIAGVKSKYKLQ